MDIQPGSLVYSKAGRDKTDLLLVLAVDGEYAYVADGKLRTVEKPKKKKFKHLQKTNTKVDISAPENFEVRNILAGYKPNN